MRTTEKFLRKTIQNKKKHLLATVQTIASSLMTAELNVWFIKHTHLNLKNKYSTSVVPPVNLKPDTGTIRTVSKIRTSKMKQHCPNTSGTTD